MHDGPHGTIKIGNKTVQTPGGGFGNPGQAGASIASPTQASLPPSLGFQPGNLNPYQQAAQTMMQAGITGLGDTNKDKREEREERERLNQSIPGAGEGILTVTPGAGTPKDDKKNVFENILSNTTFGQFVQGLDSTNRFFENLIEKGPQGLSTEDKIILAKLIGAGGLNTINIGKYADKYDVDVTELGEKFTQAASGLEAGVNIGGPNAGKIVSYEDLINNYLSGEPTGFGESFSTMYGDLKDLAFDPLRKTPNLVREDGSYTLEGLKNVLDKEGIAYLQANRPDLYLSAFGLPQTGAGLEQFANMSLQGLTGSDKDKKLSQMIIEARERIARDRQAQDKASGIMAASPALPGLPVTGPATVITPTTPTTPTGTTPTTTSVASLSPFDINAFYASLPQYSQQGIMNPNLMSYYQKLGLFPGMAI